MMSTMPDTTRHAPAATPRKEARVTDRSRRVILLMSPASYRGGSFLDAARDLGLDCLPTVDLPPGLQAAWELPEGVIALDLADPEAAVARIVAEAAREPVDAVLAVDDGATLVAARANAALGLVHNDPEAALAARDKWVMRERLRAGGVPVPWYQRFPASTDPASVAGDLEYPLVVKPTMMSGSRGVIRADDPAEFARAFARTRQIVRKERGDDGGDILVEGYLPGVEVALDGLLTGGDLRVLALFDKPDPLDGPFFEETIYVTPSRLPAGTRRAIAARAAEAARAIGLRTGPIHAELRVNDAGVWLIEMAGRSIGGLCSTILEFGAGVSLENLILRHAVGLPLPDHMGGTPGEAGSDGPDAGTSQGEGPGEGAAVMMIPIPRGGMLRGVSGEDEARAVPGVTGIEITARLNQPLVALPEGASYLGFIFARAEDPATAEAALRRAHAALRFRIDALIPLAVGD